MDISGKVGVWPTGSNYIDNELVQIYLKINNKKFIFNNYVNKEVKSLLEECLAPIMSSILVESKGSWDNRKEAISALNKYAKKLDICPYRKHQLFIEAVTWNIEEANDLDVEMETEIKFTEDLIPKALLESVLNENNKKEREINLDTEI